MINPDKFYNVEEFAELLGVCKATIYQAYSCLPSSKLQNSIPQPIKVGRSVRWSGKQIKAYQARLAAESGVNLDDLDADAASAQAQRAPGKPGRPRNTGAARSKG